MNVICNLQLLYLFQHINIQTFVTLPNAFNIFFPSMSSTVVLSSLCLLDLIPLSLSFLSQCFFLLLFTAFQSSAFLPSHTAFGLFSPCLLSISSSLSIFFSHYLLFVHLPCLFYFMFLQFSLHHSYFFLSLNLFLSSSFLCISLNSLPFQFWSPQFSNHFLCLSLALAIPLTSSCLSKTFPSTHLLRGALFQNHTSLESPAGGRMHAFGKGALSLWEIRGTPNCEGMKRQEIEYPTAI